MRNCYCFKDQILQFCVQKIEGVDQFSIFQNTTRTITTIGQTKKKLALELSKQYEMVLFRVLMKER